MDNKEVSLFKYHINNADETIQAQDINRISTAINTNQKNIIDIYDESFTNRTLFVLDNHSIVNACFIDELKNPYRIFQAKSQNIKFNDKESCITIENDSQIGIVQSTFFKPDDNAPIDELMIMTDDYIPNGAKILYFVSVDGKEFFPIKKNTSETLKLKDYGQGIFIKARMSKNKLGQSPKIFGWSVLYRDKIIESISGIRKIDFTQYGVGDVGDTIIVRDKKMEDRVVMVIEPDGFTELYYDIKNDNRLDYVLDHNSTRTIKETMKYGPYNNHENKTETVLLGTRKEYVKQDIKANLQDYVDKFKLDIEGEINNANRGIK